MNDAALQLEQNSDMKHNRPKVLSPHTHTSIPRVLGRSRRVLTPRKEEDKHLSLSMWRRSVGLQGRASGTRGKS